MTGLVGYAQDFPYANLSGSCAAPNRAVTDVPASGVRGGTSPGVMALCSGPTPVLPAGVDQADWEQLLDRVQNVLGWVGIIPGAGAPADFCNACISGYRGDYFGASISFLAMVPGVELLAPVLRQGRHLNAGARRSIIARLGTRVLQFVVRAIDALLEFVASMPGRIRAFFDYVNRSWLDPLGDRVWRRLNDAIGPVFAAIDEAFTVVMSWVDDALYMSPPLAIAAMQSNPQAARSVLRQNRGSGGGGGGGRTPARGHHLVANGLRRRLERLGCSREVVEELFNHPSMTAVFRGDLPGPDVQSTDFGRAVEWFDYCADRFFQTTGQPERVGRGIALRGALRDMLDTAVDQRAAAAMPGRGAEANRRIFELGRIIDGQIARSSGTLRHR